LGEYKSSWIFKQLEIIGEKYGFKIQMPLKIFLQKRWKMILNGGKEKI
jgi:excinuclease ABC subunit A